MAKAEATTVRVEREGAVATVTLDRPEAMNAQTRESRAELQEALRGVARDREVRAVVLTGAGRGFCAGQDLREEGALEGVGDTVRKGYVPIIRAITGMEKPVIAAVNGAAAGAGLSFALACDYRFMAEEAFAMMAFSNIALVPDSGGSWFLPRTIGYERAFELAATGRRVGSAEALELGIAQRVVPGDQLLAEAAAFATQLAERPPLALAWTKRMMRAALTASLDETMESEAQLQAAAARTADHAEGVASFLEKRPARFTGA